MNPFKRFSAVLIYSVFLAISGTGAPNVKKIQAQDIKLDGPVAEGFFGVVYKASYLISPSLKNKKKARAPKVSKISKEKFN